MHQLIETYSRVQDVIDERWDQFEKTWSSDDDIFLEMVFCLCTPQSKAEAGWKATSSIKDHGLLIDGSEDEVAKVLSDSGVRFKNKKARYILEAKERFMPRTNFSLKDFIDSSISKNGQTETRNWFADRVKGFGMKEASHFMRNIGQGDELCILDRHILRELDEHGVVPFPKKFDKDMYLTIETEMKKYSKEIKIPLFALDFVFWAETHNDIVFK